MTMVCSLHRILLQSLAGYGVDDLLALTVHRNTQPATCKQTPPLTLCSSLLYIPYLDILLQYAAYCCQFPVEERENFADHKSLSLASSEFFDVIVIGIFQGASVQTLTTRKDKAGTLANMCLATFYFAYSVR